MTVEEAREIVRQFDEGNIHILTKYYENPTVLSILADDVSVMQEYAEFAEKVEAYDSSKMSAEDATYYLEVKTRCSQKMLNVAASMGRN